jgi:hypothetical protein
MSSNSLKYPNQYQGMEGKTFKIKYIIWTAVCACVRVSVCACARETHAVPILWNEPKLPG